MRPPRPHFLSTVTLGLLAALGCGGEGGPSTPVEPAGGHFALGQSVVVDAGRDARIVGDGVSSEYVAVVVNTSLDSASRVTFSLRGTGLGPLKAPGPFGSRAPAADSRIASGSTTPAAREADLEDLFRDRERRELGPRLEAARAWHASAVPSLPTTLAIGDVVRLNFNVADPCANARYHNARVVAIGTRALILEDEFNPTPGFSAADYKRYAARFDTLVYPLITGAFGVPSDIDGNGRVAIVFTRSVNELTPGNSLSLVSGITASRDLFPQAGTPRAAACATSNEGEFVYLLAPDPSGSVNGNHRTNGFVDTSTTTVLAHELVHLINASRKLYVNTSVPRFEDKWLDEGLAHIGEELLFYRDAGLAPRLNLGYRGIRSSARAATAYASHMASNTTRYGQYLENPSSSSPYAAGDALRTRGAAWSLLRYLADRASTSDGTVWSRLVDSPVVGIPNLQAVFGGSLATQVRDWSASHALDDVPLTADEYQQRSWNFRSIFAGQDEQAVLYPLQLTGMADGTSYTAPIVGGGAGFLKLAVPANGTATLSLAAQSGAAGSLQMVVTRTR